MGLPEITLLILNDSSGLSVVNLLKVSIIGSPVIGQSTPRGLINSSVSTFVLLALCIISSLKPSIS